MARAQSSGLAKFAWPLVIFGAGFVIFLLLSIIFYAQLTGARTEAREAREDLEAFVSEQQRESEALRRYRNEAGEDQSVAGVMLAEIRALKGAIGVSEGMDREALASWMDQNSIQGSLENTVDQLRADKKALEEDLASVEEDLDDANEAIQAAERAKAELADEFTQARRKLEDQVEQSAERSQALGKKLDQMEQQLTSQLEQAREQYEGRIDELQQKNEQLTQKNRELQRRIEELLGEVRTGGAGGNDTPPDGRIVSLVSGADKVYINRGREHHLIRGTTFEVFGQDELIKYDQYDELRGKATIEVFQVNETSSIARVVRQKERTTLREGDQIVNVIYDPDRTLTFHVFGDFDVNNDGVSTSRDRNRIESMIRRWGGKVADDLDYQADYLVLGKRPEVPEEPGEGTVDPEAREAYFRARNKLEQYRSLVAEAKSLSIPVLNQNRFLSLVGYYQR